VTSSTTITLQNRSPQKFFLLVFALSIPFWLVGTMTTLQLLPGIPVAALMFVCPATAALILVYAENKTAGVTTLLKRSFDYTRIRAKVWYAPVLLLMPGVMVVSYGLMRLMGVSLPTPQFTLLAPFALFVVFFITALGEELGWSGYAIDPKQDRWGALQASILLGLVWAAWHIELPDGSQGNASSPWRAGFLPFGSTTTPTGASSRRLFSTTLATSAGNCFRSMVRITTRVSPV
jgi:membrane protease YdiL (CAAX protease family)